MTARSQLLAWLDATPDGVRELPVPVELLRAALEEESTATTAVSERRGDLTIEEVAERVHRALSTVRGWLNGGQLPGAYKLNGRDWRIPPAALDAYLKAQAEPRDPLQPAGRRGRPAELGAWRRIQPRTASR